MAQTAVKTAKVDAKTETKREVRDQVSRDDFISHVPVKLVDEMILRAFSQKTSDIHIEPAEHDCRVRIRVDGDLLILGRYKKEIHEETIARLKVLSSLRTDVRNVAQDGRFKVAVSGNMVSVRLSIVPSFFGEKCVLRLLPHTLHTHTFESLGFSEANIKGILNALGSAHGMVLVVGPTGSGKTTTLYTLLQKISRPEVATVTLEDPIEYSLPGITQIPIHQGNTSMTFVSALRAVVRQDPDVIMVGEIRDSATAELSTQAALTGHLLLSTLHTNDAVTGVVRLIDMGIEPFLVASTVRAIISQRLVRKMCQKCAVEKKISQSEIEFLKKHGNGGNVPDMLRSGCGCVECRNTGFSGRTVISEVLLVDEKIREHIMQKASGDELKESAIKNGMVPLIQDAVRKVINGETTIEEIASHHHEF